MATPTARQSIPLARQRVEMLEQIDRLEAAGADVSMLRADIAKLRLPDDTMIVTLSHEDVILGAAQLRTIVRLFSERMPDESKALLERLADAFLAAEVKS